MSAEILYDPHNHLWFRDDGGGVVSVGVARFMFSVIAAPGFICLPSAGDTFAPGGKVGSLETDKTAFSLILPFAGEVVAAFQPPSATALASAADGEMPLLAVRPASDGWMAGLVGVAEYEALSAP